MWCSSILLAALLGSAVPGVASLLDPGEDGPEALRSSTDALDFGEVVLGTSKRASVELTNATESPLQIQRVGANCNCATLRLSTPRVLNAPIDERNEGAVDLTLAAGETATMTMIVDTAKLPLGDFRKQCLVFHSGAPEPLRIGFSLNLVPRPDPEPAAEQPREPGSTPEPTGPQPVIEVDQSTADFGTLLHGESPSTIFTIRNTGEAPLLLQDLRSTCTCTGNRLWIGGEELDKQEIDERRKDRLLGKVGPGEEAKLEVEMQTGKLGGVQYDKRTRKSLHLYSNDLARNPLTLNLEATITRAFELKPAYVRFQRLRKGDEETQEVTLSSETIADYEVVGISVPNPEVLEATWERIGGGGNPSYRVAVKLKGNAPVGRLADQILLQLRHEKVPEIPLPVYAEVLPQVVFHGNAEDGTERLNFGVLTGEEDAVIELRIENLDPTTPYKPSEVELSSRYGDVFRHELIEVEEGVEYRLKLTASKDIDQRFFNGRIRISAEHPDVPVKLLDFRGWVNRSQEDGPGKQGSGGR